MWWQIGFFALLGLAFFQQVWIRCLRAELNQCEAELARFRRHSGAAEAGAFARGAVAALGDSQVQE